MNFFKQTTLIGIGLIGSSIARALKKNGLLKKFVYFLEQKKQFIKQKNLN